MSNPAERLTETISPAELQEAEKTDLYAALTHPKMLSGLRTIARHARNEGIEGGIAAYTSASRISVSKPLIISQEDASRSGAYQPAAEGFKAGYESFDADTLI